MTLLPLVEKVDDFPYDLPSKYHCFRSHDGILLGYILPEIASRLQSPDFEHQGKNVKFAAMTFEERNAIIEKLGQLWLKSDEFLQHNWRNELYTVYAPTGKPYFLVERAVSCLLGVVTYGVHINGYVPALESPSGKLQMWIPTRSVDKATYPSMLDNTIAGGLAHPLGIWDNVVKESYEEAGLKEDFVTANAKPAGVISYIVLPDGPGGKVQPEVEFIYDLIFPDNEKIIPKPVDGEASGFELMELDQIKSLMEQGRFKPNCALVIIDFLIRHGHISPELEPNYMEISQRIHRKLPFPTI